jgi:hypothetical protein
MDNPATPCAFFFQAIMQVFTARAVPSVHRAGRSSHHLDLAMPFSRRHADSPKQGYGVVGVALRVMLSSPVIKPGVAASCMSTRSTGWTWPSCFEKSTEETWGRWNADSPGEARLSGWCPL